LLLSSLCSGNGDGLNITSLLIRY